MKELRNSQEHIAKRQKIRENVELQEINPEEQSQNYIFGIRCNFRTQG